jgi:hypothetical protein
MPAAFAVILKAPDAGAHAADTAAMDWFVLATLCTLFFLLGCIATAAWQIWRRTTRPQPHEQLLQELAEADPDALLNPGKGSDADETPRAVWEKPADWWRQP